MSTLDILCSSSSIGRASAFQAECCEFKSRLLLQSNWGYNDNNSTLPIIFEVRKAPDAPLWGI